MIALEFMHAQPVELTPDDVWRCLGPAGGAVEGLAADVADAAAEATRLSEPIVCGRALAIQAAGRGRVRFDGGVEIEGRMMPHLFEGAEGGLFLLVTAGPGPEQRVAELFADGRHVEAFALDAAASAVAMAAYSSAIDEAAAALQAAGYQTGPCLVPGSDYWELEGQRAIFHALPAERLGIQLLDSMVMTPQKSQSGLIPCGRELRILDDPAAAPCRTAARGAAPPARTAAGVPTP